MKRLLIILTLVASIGATNVFSQRIIWENTFLRANIPANRNIGKVQYLDTIMNSNTRCAV